MSHSEWAAAKERVELLEEERKRIRKKIAQLAHESNRIYAEVVVQQRIMFRIEHPEHESNQ